MSLELTKIDKPTSYQNVPGQPEAYRGVQLVIPNAAIPAGAGAGLPVQIDFTNSGLSFKDTNYIVLAMNTSAQHLGFTIAPGDKTTFGFVLKAYPGDASDTVAAGTCDIMVFYQD